MSDDAKTLEDFIEPITTSISEGVNSKLAPGITTIELLPSAPTVIGATPVKLDSVVKTKSARNLLKDIFSVN